MSLTITLLLLMGTCLCTVVAKPCTFPRYLEGPDWVWETKLKNQRMSSAIHVRFRGSIMSNTDYSTSPSTHTDRECTRSMPKNKYILAGNATTGRTEFMCIQVIKRSAYVLQLKKSPASTLFDPNLCDDSKLLLDDWPLVYPSAETYTEECILKGGYDMHIYNSKGGRLCSNKSPMTARIESECMPGEGLIFDFWHEMCVDQTALYMQRRHTAVCLGNWKGDKYQYMVLGDQGDYPKVWLMRLPLKLSGKMSVQLFLDVVASTADAVKDFRHYRLQLNKRRFPTLCEDEGSACTTDICGGAFDLHCQKTCGKCSALEVATHCTFETNTKGEWLASSHHGSQDITVTNSLLYVNGFSHFQCLNIVAGTWMHTDGRKIISTVLKNGCKPRYSCVELRNTSSSVLQYRLSQSLQWPHSLYVGAFDICNSARFKDDEQPVSDRYRSRYNRFIVAKYETQRISEDCKLPGTFEFYVNYTDGAACPGKLSACSSKKELALTLDGCDQKPAKQTFRCLASYHTWAKQFLITEHIQDRTQLHCWVMDYNVLPQRSHKMYQMYASDCHDFITAEIDLRGYDKYLAAFTYHKVKDSIDNCIVPSTTTTTTSTTTQRSTTKPSTTSITTTTTREEHILHENSGYKTNKPLETLSTTKTLGEISSCSATRWRPLWLLCPLIAIKVFLS